MDFLTKIIAAKRERLAVTMAETPLEDIRALAREIRAGAKPNRLAKAFRDASKPNIIAEFKRRSPSKGEINPRANALEVIEAYESAGAAAVSVLTEEDFFGGSLSDLREIRAATMLPLLRKDFVFDEYQIYESAAAGADALLLIVAALDDETLSRLRLITEDELGVDALVEVHDEAELDRAVECGAKLIGVNNRNLRTFDVSLATSERLARLAPVDAILISESGLHPKDVPGLQALGYKGFLVGETLMRAEDPRKELRSFIEAGRSANPSSVKVKICGLTSVEDAVAAIDAGADMLGLNFFRPSPRFIEPEAAREIVDAVRSRSDVAIIGVFVNEPSETILRVAHDLKLDGVQLHGDETAEFCEQLKSSFQGLVIKAVPGSAALALDSLKDYPADSIMLDAFDPALRGGTGHSADWTIARRAAETLPDVILAGGLSPENVADAIASVHPSAVDACSSLESSPGKKDFMRMREFVNAVRTSKLQTGPSLSLGREGN
jgi:indole-3-glycerol phosphate synthase/phosphoribosylanthranilate isomerase/anthranilate synthase/indole-3-glycerol phosphate synthase/phosphoribosylanthranilate isomerase